MPMDICSMNISRHDWPNEDVGLWVHLNSRNSRNLSIIAIITGLDITTQSSIPSTNSTLFLGFNIDAEEITGTLIKSLINSLNTPSALRQVYSLFQSQFSTQCELVLPLSVRTIPLFF